MKFSELAKYLDKLEKTSSRLEITGILADLYKKSKAEEIDKITHLLLGRLAPSYENVVFNIAEKMMLRVISDAYGVELAKVREDYKKKGDLGNVVFAYAQNQKSKIKNKKSKKDLSVLSVYQKLLDAAGDEGEGSQKRKVGKLAELFSKLDPLGARYVARIPVGKLRLGFSDRTVIDALSWMKYGDKSRSGEIEKAYFVLPDVGFLAREIKSKGIERVISEVKPKIGAPVLPMLAQRLKSPTEMIKKMGRVSIEPKFDGLRIQIHYRKLGFDDGTKCKVFTRNLNETSWMFPELAELGEQLNSEEIILDSEAVGVDEERQRMANFQMTMTRRRKHEIGVTSKNVAIKFWVFDVLLCDGESLINKTYEERRAVLERVIVKGQVLVVVDHKITKDSVEIEREMRRNLSKGMEGIIVKKADSKYVPGRTGWRWVKMKEEEGSRAKLADTIDCVVMGHYAGRGKRSGFGLGGFLVGVKDGEQFLTFTKVGTGLTDEQFKELKERLFSLEINKKPREYGGVAKNLIPDRWVSPSLVVELAADEITKSPSHSLGYALRFPRLVKFRGDKSANQATSVAEIKRLFSLQKS